jgi:hypothetical protein
LDDVDRLEEVAAAARSAAETSPAIAELASHLRSQLFYLELDEAQPPRFVSGSFVCKGHLRCRLQAGTPEYEAFMAQLRESGAYFRNANRNFQVSGMSHSRNFRRTFCFHVASRFETFDVKLDEGTGQRHINGSPFTIDWLARQQKLDAVFGTADHRKRRSGDTSTPFQVKRRRVR